MRSSDWSSGVCSSDLLPVGWTSAAQARREIVGLRDAALALGGDAALADLTIVPWTVPRLLPAARDLLFDSDALPHVPQLRSIADLLARAVLCLADDPAAACDSADALFGAIDAVDRQSVV